MKAFLEQLFEFDFKANQKWIDAIEEQDVTSFIPIRRQMCHIINVHHLWVNRLHSSISISEDWDDLPFYSWQKLNEENFRLTMEFIENESLSKMIHYTTSEGEEKDKSASAILYHMLQHATHHRAVINSLLASNSYQPVELNFIAINQ